MKQTIYDVTLEGNRKVTLAEQHFKAKFPKPGARHFDRLLQLREFFPDAIDWQLVDIDELGNATVRE